MLPGGLEVIGVFALATTVMLKESQTKLCQVRSVVNSLGVLCSRCCGIIQSFGLLWIIGCSII